jgi:acylphosphatase
MSTSILTRHLSITGLVQGVGYRVFFKKKARALLLSGWVRNRLDGSVEAMVSGDADAIGIILAWAKQGPPGARVSAIIVTEGDASFIMQGSFDKLPTY